MGKTQVLSALALAIAMTMVGGSLAYAQEGSNTINSTASTAVVSTQSDSVGSSDIGTLKSEVAAASESSKGNKAYPGLSKYLSDLATTHNASEDVNQAYADAMKEALIAAELLNGRNVGNTVSSKARTMSDDNSVSATTVEISSRSDVGVNAAPVLTEAITSEIELPAEETPQATYALMEDEAPIAKLATAIKVVVDGQGQAEEVAVKNYEEDGAAIDDELINKDDVPEVIPELPKTGEVESNLGILITAGVIVAVVVLGATAIILKAKKRSA